LIAASSFQAADGHAESAVRLQKVWFCSLLLDHALLITSPIIQAAGGFLFGCSLGGWYLLLVQLLASLEFPMNLPVGDMTNIGKKKA